MVLYDIGTRYLGGVYDVGTRCIGGILLSRYLGGVNDVGTSSRMLPDCPSTCIVRMIPMIIPMGVTKARVTM